MFDDGRSAGEHVRITLQNIVRVLAFEPIQQGRVAIHVIEVFEQAEAIYLREVRIGFLLCQRSRELDGDLLITDGRLERRVIGAQQPVDHRRLMVLDATYLGERPP
jgi:hypothetical protein